MNNYRNTEAIVIPIQNSDSSNSSDNNSEDEENGSNEFDDEFRSYNRGTPVIQAKTTLTSSLSDLTDINASSFRDSVTEIRTKVQQSLTNGKRRSTSAAVTRHKGTTGHSDSSGNRRKHKKRKKRKFRIPGSNNTKTGSKSKLEEEQETLPINSVQANKRVTSAPISVTHKRIINRMVMSSGAKLKVDGNNDINKTIIDNCVFIESEHDIPTSVQKQNQQQTKEAKVINLGGGYCKKTYQANSSSKRYSSNSASSRTGTGTDSNTTMGFDTNGSVQSETISNGDNKSGISAAQQQNGVNNSIKPRSMLLALSKESYSRTLPSMLQSQSMNFIFGSSNDSHNNKKSLPYDYSNNIKTAVSQYASNTGPAYKSHLVFNREFANPRCIPIGPDIDNTRVGKFLNSSILCRSDSSIGLSSVLNKDLITTPKKSILKDQIGLDRSYTANLQDKKKSVRFNFSGNQE